MESRFAKHTKLHVVLRIMKWNHSVSEKVSYTSMCLKPFELIDNLKRNIFYICIQVGILLSGYTVDGV